VLTSLLGLDCLAARAAIVHFIFLVLVAGLVALGGHHAIQTNLLGAGAGVSVCGTRTSLDFDFVRADCADIAGGRELAVTFE
jgi:hypothetical protein